MVVGRGSFTEAFPLFGLNLRDYDALFEEKLDLLRLRDEEHVHWAGKHRPALTGQGVHPRPMQARLPIWLGVGGTPESFVRVGTLGLPLMVAVTGEIRTASGPSWTYTAKLATVRATRPSSYKWACTRWAI